MLRQCSKDDGTIFIYRIYNGIERISLQTTTNYLFCSHVRHNSLCIAHFMPWPLSCMLFLSVHTVLYHSVFLYSAPFPNNHSFLSVYAPHLNAAEALQTLR